MRRTSTREDNVTKKGDENRAYEITHNINWALFVTIAASQLSRKAL